jgi:acyl-CoA reductase-like NAD-dependent aldehyde dehydrogenase
MMATATHATRTREARLCIGGESVDAAERGTFEDRHPFTLLNDVPEDSVLACAETFRPVASIEVVDNAEKAIEEFTDPRWITVQSGTRPFPS